jgi:type I restriction enzyme S subunit
MGELPTSWNVKPLKFCADLITERVDGSSSVGSIYVGLEHIESRTGRLVRAEGSQDSAESTVSCFQEGDVLFGKLRPYLAKAAVAEAAGVCSSEILVYRPNGLTAPYLKHVMLLDGFIEEVNASTYGSKMPRADATFISRLAVPQPPLDEQIAIASYLDAETARIDGLIEEKVRLTQTLKEMRRSTVAEAVTRGVRGDRSMRPSGLSWVPYLPAEWSSLSLKRFVRLSGGHTPSTGNPAFWDGDMPWFSPKDMKADELHDSIDHVTELAVQESGLQVIEPGTTMIVVRGMILAHTFPVCVSQVKATINQDMKALVPEDGVDRRYLPWLLRGASALFLSLTEQSAHGTMALRTDRFMSEQLPIPPLSEQVEIVKHLEAERARIDALLSQIDREVELLRELRSATITDAVLGRIDVST